MLKSIWDKTVKFYQGQCQAGDAYMIGNIDHRINNARNGYTEHMLIAARTGYSRLVRIPLTPEAAAQYIETAQKEREALVRKMDQRREKYGLKL